MDYISLVKTYSKPILDSIFKIFLVVVVLLGVISLFVSFLPKQKTDISNDYESRNEKLYKILNNPKLSEDGNKVVPVAILRTVLCTTSGNLCTDNPKDVAENSKNSLISQITSLTVMPLENPPASGAYYVLNKIKDAGLIPSTLAAPLEGIGFASLKPFQNIWLMFRNFVYLFFVVIIVIIGFMIMFRAKLNAQTAISVESALPKIVISLLLVTFSFAIAGFLIDLMYVSIGMIVLVFSNSIPNTNIGALLKEFLYNPEIFGGGLDSTRQLTWNLASSLTHLFPGFIRDILATLSFLVLSELGTGVLLFFSSAKTLKFTTIYYKIVEGVKKFTSSGTFVVSLVAAVIEVALFWLVSSLLSQVGLTLIIFLLLVFTVVLVLIRITFLVLYSYINILLLTILSPLILAFEAIPGKSTFSGWLKSMVFHLLTFPALTIIVLLSRSIMGLNLSSGSAIWQPPGAGGLDPQSFQTLIGAALIFMAPDLIKTFKQLSGIKPMSNDISLMGLFAGGMAVGSTATGLLGKAQSFSYMTSGLERMGLIKSKKPAEGGNTRQS